MKNGCENLPNLNLLIKPASSNCNLNCGYCFYHDVAKNREISSYGMMSIDTLETIIKKAIACSDRSVSFAFQGGEPTLVGLDFFKHVINLQKEYNTKGLSILNAIQTNGTLIDEEWAEFLAKNKFLVGLSLDGPKNIHDMNRIDFKQNGSHKKAENAFRLFNKYGVDYNVLCVVTKNVAKHTEKVYNYYLKQDFKYLQFIPCLDNLGEEPGQNLYSLSPKEYGNFLNRLFDLWYRDIRQDKRISIRMFDNILLALKGYPPESCDMNGRCTVCPTIESDGSVYPCDFYVLDNWKLGNILNNSFENIIKNDVAESFVNVSNPITEKCIDCKYFTLCKGGCRRHYEPIGAEVDTNYFCDSYKSFYEYTLDRFFELARWI